MKRTNAMDRRDKAAENVRGSPSSLDFDDSPSSAPSDLEPLSPNHILLLNLAQNRGGSRPYSSKVFMTHGGPDTNWVGTPKNI